MANFDRVARIYRWAEYLTLGPLLQRTRVSCLRAVQQCRHALVIGDGDGRFLAELLRAAPMLSATAVDSSAAMLTLLQRRCRSASARLQVKHMDLRNAAISPPPSTDLVATHFVLDCLDTAEVECLAERVSASLLPGGLWLISDFALPHRKPWRWLGALYIRALYVAFQLFTGLAVSRLPQIESALLQHGFRRMQRIERLGGLLYSEVWMRVAP